MVINREFFVRGWLPAGLVVNARLLTNTAVGSNLAVMKPVINPVPGASWPADQAQLVFPIEQATDQSAVVLLDPFEDGTLALLPLGRWFGSGTPYILAINTWYEGRVRIISGTDVMGIRIAAQVVPKYYSQPEGLSDKDVSIRSMACHHIPGRQTRQVLALDDKSLTATELGYSPKVSVEGADVAARVMNLLLISSPSFAGMRVAHSELTPGTQCRFLQCEITAGQLQSQEPKYIGIIPNGSYLTPHLYSVIKDKITAVAADIVKPDVWLGTTAQGSYGDDQVVHYN